MRNLNFHNLYHLGDSYLQNHYMRKLVEHNDVTVNLYTNPNYINELQNYNNDSFYKERIHFYDIKYTPFDSHNCWIGEPSYPINFHKEYKHNMDYDTFYVKFFKQLSDIARIDCPIQNENDMLLDNETIKYRIFDKYDYLIVNSVPYSGQYPTDKIDSEFLKLLKRMTGKIITTKKVDGYECTSDYNLSLLGIGQLSLYVNNVIAIHTSPLIPTFNKWSIDSIKRWIIIRKEPIKYSYKNVYSCTKINDIDL